ncbi:unnamed protein product, partial [Schistocephalus solidus]|uniref:VP1 n=1 Tax=Schistocephalus solidus TaxID=70667 RepID=A0A183TTP1_SCHSO
GEVGCGGPRQGVWGCGELTAQRNTPQNQALTLFNLFYNTIAERNRASTIINIDAITKRIAAIGEDVHPAAEAIAKFGPARGARVVYLRNQLYQIHGVTPDLTMETQAVGEPDTPTYTAAEGLPDDVRDDLHILRLRVTPAEGVRTAEINEASRRRLRHIIINPDGQVVPDSGAITIDSQIYLLVPVNLRGISSIIQFLVAYGSTMITDEYSVATLKVVATVPVLLNGVPSEGSARVEKHFANIAQSFGVSDGVARGAASGCRVTC